ncbi:MAG: EspA/EspE family type VII secretion system effector [Actinomycetota bacterium]
MVVSDVAGASGKVDGGACAARGTSDILAAGQRLIAGMRSTTGSGRPDSGESFARGATGFRGAARTVGCAYPGDAWQGVGAQAYRVAASRLAGTAEALALLDRDVHIVLDREAAQVVRRREAFDDQVDQLSSLRRVTSSLAAIPGVGAAMKSSIEMAAVTAAVGVSSAELHDLAAETADNASRLRRIAGEYLTLEDEATADDQKTGDEMTGDEVPAGEVAEPQTSQPGEDAASTDDSGVTDPVAGPSAVVSAPPPVTAAPMCPASAPASTPGEEPPMQADLMSGLTSAFGAVGGMIGAAVSPLAAMVSAAVAAAGQLPSLASDAAAQQPVAAQETPEASGDATGIDEKPLDADADADAKAEPEPETSAPVGSAEAQASPGSAPVPPPSPPPAATRPPQ